MKTPDDDLRETAEKIGNEGIRILGKVTTDPEYKKMPKAVTQTLYQVSAVIRGAQVPTFYLDAQVQGIVNARQAEQIAESILNTRDVHNPKDIHLAVMEINYEVLPWKEM